MTTQERIAALVDGARRRKAERAAMRGEFARLRAYGLQARKRIKLTRDRPNQETS